MTEFGPWTVDALPMDATVIAAAKAGELFLLPLRVDEYGNGLYSELEAGLPKTARAYAVDIQFSHPVDRQRYLSEYSSYDVWLNIAFGIAGNLSTDAIKYMYQVLKIRLRTIVSGTNSTIEEAPVEVRFLRFEASDTTRVIEGFEFRGPAGEFERVAQSLLEPGAGLDGSAKCEIDSEQHDPAGGKP